MKIVLTIVTAAIAAVTCLLVCFEFGSVVLGLLRTRLLILIIAGPLAGLFVWSVLNDPKFRK